MTGLTANHDIEINCNIYHMIKLIQAMTIAASVATAFGAGQAAAAPQAMRLPSEAGRDAESAIPRLKGAVLFSNAWSATNQTTGIYYLPTKSSELFEEIFTGYFGTFGHFEMGDYYFTTERVSNNESWIVAHTVWNATTGSFVNSFMTEGDCSQVAIDCAKDMTTGIMYAVTFTPAGDKYQLSAIDFTRNSATSIKIGEFDCEIAALGCTAQGQLYAISRERNGKGEVTGSSLLKVNKADATYQKIGSGTGCKPHYLSSASIDPNTGRMYWTVSPSDNLGALYEVNLQSGAATLVYAFPDNEQVVGLQVAAQYAEDKAPAAPENLEMTFDGGSLSGKLTCDVPATTFDGEAASGNLSYTVTIDGDVAGEGTTAYGARISHDVTVDKPGIHTFTVYTTNTAGNSPKTSVKTFVGFGQPAAPANVAATWNDGTISLNWDAVSTATDGGYINPADITYTAYRQDGSVAVSDTKTTSFSEPCPVPDSPHTYYFTVTAHNGSLNSKSSQSNSIALGTTEPPLSTTFSDGAHTLEGYTVIDANKDGRTWIWDDKGNGLRAPYNTDFKTPMDDWLMTPGLQLKAGYAYDLTFDASVIAAQSAETFEVKMGNDNTAEAMTISLIPSTTISNTTPQSVSARVMPSQDGVYYIGIHCISDAGKYYLYVNNLSVGTAQGSDLPETPADFKVTPAKNGEYAATIAFKTPSTTINGKEIKALSKVTIERDGVTVHTFDNPTPNTTLSYTDKPETAGRYTYTAAAYNESGRGLEASAEAVVGIDVPAMPDGVKLKETANLGEVTATWNSVTTDHNGTAIPAGKVTYDVYSLDSFSHEWKPVATGLTETSYTFRWTDQTDEQVFANVGIAACSENGSSEIQSSGMTAVGTPYTSIRESAANGWLSHIWAMEGDFESMGLFRDSSIRSCSSQDGDDGYIFMRANGMYQSGFIQSGKLDLSDMSSPGLTFYTYNFVGSDGESDSNDIDVSVRGSDGEFRTVLSTTVASVANYSKEPGWAKCHVPLDSYAGQVVELRITGAVNSFSYIMLDNIFAGSLPDKDMAVTGISAPMRVAPGADYSIEVSVFNNGLEPAQGWTVDLYENDEVIKTLDGSNLDSNKAETLVFDMTMSPVATNAAKYHAVINQTGDKSADNNESETITVTPIVAHHPRAMALKAEDTESGISLSWTAPALSTTPETVTEDFENADAFAHDYADWIFADLDDTEVGGFNEFVIPGIVNTQSKSSFFVFDPTELGLGTQFAAHSGDKYLSSLVLWDDSEVNDWAISPELSGNAQTISFWARSFQSAYPEKIEVLYSTSSTDPSDFKTVTAASEVPATWTKYQASLPQGAKHFAIRSCAEGNFMLMVDDVTYEAKALADKYSVSGYNVYRNGDKLNDTPVTATGYLDGTPGNQTNTYVVTAVYAQGESAPSNAVNIASSGLQEVFGEIADGEAVYYNMQGIRVANPVRGEIYIRCKGGNTRKVIVK